MNTDTLNPALLPGARNAIETCLAILPGEKVALIFDEPTEEVAASLRHALEDRKAIATTFRIEDYTARPATHAPGEILAGLELADAGILCMQPLEGELRMRRDIVGVVERRQIRYAHMVRVTPEIM
jgi:hypothetical protein